MGKGTGKFVAGVAVGAAVGAGLGVLFAPKSGKEKKKKRFRNGGRLVWEKVQVNL